MAADSSIEDIKASALAQIVSTRLPVSLAESNGLDQKGATWRIVEQPGGATAPVEALRGERVVLLSAIAKPASFRATVEALGAEVVQEFVHRDHHRFTRAEVEAAVAAARAADARLVTTEKDDARLEGVDAPRSVLRIDLGFVDAPPAPAELLL